MRSSLFVSSFFSPSNDMCPLKESIQNTVCEHTETSTLVSPSVAVFAQSVHFQSKKRQILIRDTHRTHLIYLGIKVYIVCVGDSGGEHWLTCPFKIFRRCSPGFTSGDCKDCRILFTSFSCIFLRSLIDFASEHSRFLLHLRRELHMR